MTQPRAHIAAMAPYALADLSVPEGVRLISLSQNESFRPPSPRAVEAGAKALAGAALYPDPEATQLRQALGKMHDLDPDTILCGNGSLDLISTLARCFAGPDRAVLTPAHAYPFFRTVAQMSEARIDAAPEVDLTVSIDALIEAARPDTGICFVANPGNPTGTRVPVSKLRRLRAALADDVLLVIDEAYGEFADHLDERCFDMVQAGNTVVLRTFSKAYGLAGCRIGWGVFPRPVLDQLRKIQNPNAVSLASEATALGALEDQKYMQETCAQTMRMRDDLAVRLQDVGYQVPPSFTNFLLLNLGTADAAHSLDAALRAEGILLRAQGGAGLPHCLRLTIGPPVHNDAAFDVLARFARMERIG